MARQVELLEGSIPGTLTRLAAPIMGSQLIQMAYNLVDMLWIGWIGAGAVAAVGAAGMYVWLANGLVVLARMGGQVLVDQNLGAGDRPLAGRCAAEAIRLGSTLAVLTTLVTVGLNGPLIRLLGLNGADVIAQGRTYLVIVGLGMVFTFLNPLLTALITATGNSRTPFAAMCAGLGINFILDPALIFGWGPLPAWGVGGAAAATVLAQAVVFVFLLAYARNDESLFRYVHLRQKPDRQLLGRLCRISAPATVQNALFPLIAMVISRLVASWGDDAVAVQKVGSQVESISWMVADGFAMALNSFIGQNYGAGNTLRARQGYRVAMRLMTLWGLLCTGLLIGLARPIFSLFIHESAVQTMGQSYLVILGFSELFMCWEILVAGAFAGFGSTLIPSLVSTVLTAARIPLALALSSTALGLNGVWWSISLSSIGKGILLVIAFAWFQRRIPDRAPRAGT